MSNPKIKYGPSQKPWDEQVPEEATVTAPSENPLDVYPSVPPQGLDRAFPELDYKRFELSPQGLSKRQRMEAMLALEQFAKTQHMNFTGFQVNEDLNYSSLSWLLDMHTNNVGDPYTSGYCTLNTKLVERSVLDYFAALWNAEWPHHEADGSPVDYSSRYWGYVMSMGSTEGNLYAVYNGRNYLDGGAMMEDQEPGTQGADRYQLLRDKPVPVNRTFFMAPADKAKNPHKYTPVAFYSEDAHYSVVKSMNVMQVKTFYELGLEITKETGVPCPINDGIWPTAVPSHNIVEDDTRSGSIKVDDLERLVRFFLERGYPPLIVLNIGSTWKGAYDDVPAVNKMMETLGKDYDWLWEREVSYLIQKQDGKGHIRETKIKDKRRGFWLHVDGALGAPFLPFIEMAHNRGEIKNSGPVFDFRNRAVMSICCSMHKWIGGPWPGGVYMTKTGYQLKPPAADGYIGSPDTTLGGSRNAFSPVILWLYFARKSYEENIKKAVTTDEVSRYLKEELKKLETYIQDKMDPSADLWIHRSELSLAVRFRMVNPTIAYKYTVDAERLVVPLEDGRSKEERTMGHIYSMQSLARFDIVDAFIGEVKETCDAGGWKAAFPEAAEKTIDGKPNPGERTPI